MKRQFLLVVAFVVFISWSVNAQIFWKVSGNGLAKTSYLFGTHHLIEKEQIKDFDRILAICNKAEAVVCEIDMRDKSLQAKLAQATVMSEGDMKDLLSPEDYILVDNEFKNLLGAGMSQLGKMKPVMLDNLFQIMWYLKENGLKNQPEAIDMIFQKNASDNNKKVIGLETAEDQINALFNSLSLKRQAEILVKDVKEKKKGIELLKKLNEYYLTGNLRGLEALNKEDDSMTEEEMKVLKEDRNNKWMKQLPDLMKEQSCFIAVGCLHLTGETGLINQLKKAGYSVEPVVM
ncbi:MAG: TraB/GumN family protein [Bacteroidales bacterium]|nr:TraB/GumN family protein [Bacteroidales bacterium]MDD4711939.1 TraB/GumN family protein [Bacteroidales bacterium]